MPAERLQKVLAHAGQGSRRVCEGLIAEGRISVNGRTATLGDKADPKVDVIAIDGERIHVNTDLVYLLFNKPAGVVTTANDPEGRPTVIDYVPANPRVFPVGRLDQDTTGLLLLTNDGELANRVTHPRYEIEKTYMVQIRGPVSRKHLHQLLNGVELDDGPAKARKANLKIADQTRSLLEIVIAEGRNREVRRMMKAVGLELEQLVRVRIGPIYLGDIGPGKVRPLNGKEVRELYAAVGLDAAPNEETS
ncbi:Ribosomal large subunit pseudouridine synthase B [Euzebya pacifica]|uniref:Pseudouridine synthase n=1 Tax=Euzebya pacifica TaxID=1608957 RepID=A0A346XWH7_9ACTN|nr:pseudouridine synthase [Euzebya pacifica]AXV06574.1 Ribosomal large subunit pseudouridine synthase B [Euzebya pacifica]